MFVFAGAVIQTVGSIINNHYSFTETTDLMMAIDFQLVLHSVVELKVLKMV